MRAEAARLGMAMVVPVYEEAGTCVYYNTAAVIDADGRYLGKFRKIHIPHVVGFNEKFYFKPGDIGYPVFETAFCKVGVYICYDRHFPEGWRELAMNGAEVIFNPSATARGLSDHLWNLEQPAAAGSRTASISAPTTASAWRRRGTPATSTAPATSSIRAARYSTRVRTTVTRWSRPSSTSP